MHLARGAGGVRRVRKAREGQRYLEPTYLDKLHGRLIAEMRYMVGVVHAGEQQ